MFYLFSSDHELRFKRNVLDVLCYPEKHIFRFRYHPNHVAPEIKEWYEKGELDKKLKKFKGKGLSIYAEATGSVPNKTYDFYPLREIEIIRVQVVGNVYYVDFRLGCFLDYYSTGQHEALEQLRKLQGLIKTIKFHPLLLLANNPETGERQGLTWTNDGKLDQYNGAPGFTNQGYFFLYVDDTISSQIKYSIGQPRNHKAWESVAEILSSAPTMQSAVFYLVEGFYRIRRRFVWIGEHEEYLIEPKDDSWDTRYPLKMGTSVVLKLLFFRSSKAAQIRPSLEIKTDGDAFAGFSQKEIRVESRYNEERVLIACKRVFDSIFAPIRIELKETTPSDQRSVNPLPVSASTEIDTPWGVLEIKRRDVASKPPDQTKQDVLAPQPFLLTQITASRPLIFATLIFLALASFFLFMSPDYIESIGWSRLFQTRSKALGDLFVRNAAVFAQVSKVLGFVFTLAAGYLGFRKLPLGR